jgi:hypothetical protein
MVKSGDLGRQAMCCFLPIHPPGIHHDVAVVTIDHLASDVVLCPVGRQFHVVTGNAYCTSIYRYEASVTVRFEKHKARSPPFGALLNRAIRSVCHCLHVTDVV